MKIIFSLMNIYFRILIMDYDYLFIERWHCVNQYPGYQSLADTAHNPDRWTI